MGAASSTHSFDDKAIITEGMQGYQKKWAEEIQKTNATQSAHFKAVIPEGEDDFTDLYKSSRLDQFFTNDALALPVKYSYNCNHLYRSSKDTPHILVFSNAKYKVLQPLGEPGRDLGESEFRIAHFMVVRSNGDVITFNELLPSSHEEKEDLRSRLQFADEAYVALRQNTPVNMCGDEVKTKAIKMGLQETTGVRDFMVAQIMEMDEEFRAGRPGYKLLNEGSDVAGEKEKIAALAESAFTNANTTLMKCIQPPNLNTQLLSHIHLFLTTGDIPQEVQEKYVNVETILEIKDTLLPGPQHMPQPEPEPEPEPNGSVCSSFTPAAMCGDNGAKDEEEDLGAPLMRQASKRPGCTSPTPDSREKNQMDR